MQDISIAAGSVRGYHHRQFERNRQDATKIATSPLYRIGVVCDGCGSGANSELGAGIGARLVVGQLARNLETYAYYRFDADAIEDLLARTQNEVLLQLTYLVSAMYGKLEANVEECFNFTVLGIFVTEALTGVFGVGDGYTVVNGFLMQYGPFPNNMPPYLSYGGLISPPPGMDRSLTTLRPLAVLPTHDVQSAMVATDGFGDVITAYQQEKTLPIKSDEPMLAESPEIFWTDERIWKNADFLRRRLARYQGRYDAHGCLLDDDTSIVAVGRLPNGGVS